MPGDANTFENQDRIQCRAVLIKGMQSAPTISLSGKAFCNCSGNFLWRVVSWHQNDQEVGEVAGRRMSVRMRDRAIGVGMSR